MTASLRLHYAPDNASLCVRLALEELGQPYETQLVDRRSVAQKSSAYLALNPNGLIPVLETPHGPMFETGAILLWLADEYDLLMPPVTDPARAHAVQWLFWIANTLHPTLRMLFYPTQYTDGDHEALRQTTRNRLTAQFDLLQEAPNADWLDTGGPSAQGCYLAPLLRWPALFGGDTGWYKIEHWPRLHAFAKRMEQRDAAVRAATAEGLGPTPFSSPHTCNPPEGSAV